MGWGDSTFFQDERLQQTGLFFCQVNKSSIFHELFCILGCQMGFLVSILNILGFGVTTPKLLNISFVLWHVWFNCVENCCLVAVYCVVCCCFLLIRSQEPWISCAFQHNKSILHQIIKLVHVFVLEPQRKVVKLGVKRKVIAVFCGIVKLLF